MTISRQEYEYAAASAAAAQSQSSPRRRLKADSTLRDRTPVAQPKPLDDGQFIWGEASEFAWGSNSNTKETGPYNVSYGDVTWPPPPTEDDPQGERQDLQPKYETWKEVNRNTRTVRVTGSNGAWVDDVRFVDVSFSVPADPDGRPKFVTLTFAA